MMNYQKILVLALALLGRFCNAANILIVLPYTGKSHYIMLRPIGLELAQRGHNVTVITPFEETIHPRNYRQIISDDVKLWETLAVSGSTSRQNVFSCLDKSMEDMHKEILWEGGAAITEHALRCKNVQDFLKEDNNFDLVINEVFAQEAFYTLAHKYNAPQVLITTYGNSMLTNMLMRNPTQMATVIYEFAENRHPTSFFGRLLNLYHTLFVLIYWKFYYLEKQEKLVKKYLTNLPEPVPNLEDIQRNASLVLMNSHFSFDTPAAYLPNFIEIGGLHVNESSHKSGNLSEDLQKILHKANNGVVYVNFGSNIQSSELPEEKKNAFLKVFKKLKQTVIWKWEDDTLKDLPSNIITRKWLPQTEILAHPNVKVFVSHGGMLGTQEAIYYGVPIIGIPIYADQYNNLLHVQEGGYGKILEYNNLNEKTLEHEINEVLTNKNYAIKAKAMQARFKDRPMKPLETAIFWIEYVIRNKGAEFIKPPGIKLSWAANNMLDVYTFIIVSILFVVIIIPKLLLILLRKLFVRSPATLPSVIRKNK